MIITLALKCIGCFFEQFLKHQQNAFI